ncbi:MAG: nicotinate (nicotinamide) nucleotide adenylyltransferase [Desulfovibrionaceae bacterium]|nr:nicotinate (nicotinamide) nucleotide adenylyltransferase [Desulfovibrionaceae bacterium]
MKIGILGGSFNPVHTGHVRMAVEALEQVGLDRVGLMPAKNPPHKRSEDMLPFGLRLDMVRLAVAGVGGLDAEPIEGTRPGPSFTCDTLTCFRTERPRDEFHFILGASTFLELPKWKRGPELPGLASFIVVNRWEAAGDVAGFLEDNWPEAERKETGLWRFPDGTTVRLIDIPRLDIKGAQIRRRWRERRDLSLLVPEGVRVLLEERADEIGRYWGKRVPNASGASGV